MSTWKESDNPRDSDGWFAEQGGGKATETEEKRVVELLRAKKKTPAEKIASVNIEAGKDNILPELNECDLSKIGAEKISLF